MFSITYNFSFTTELENNPTINYLDLTIHRKSDTLKFSIFQKPTHTDVIILFSSHHPKEEKQAALRYFINRQNP